MSSTRTIWICPSDGLRRRLNLAAADKERGRSTYCRLIVEKWASDPQREAPSDTEEYGGDKNVHFHVRTEVHRALRLDAARMDVTVSELALRILAQECPFEVEILERAMTSDPSPTKAKEA